MTTAIVSVAPPPSEDGEEREPLEFNHGQQQVLQSWARTTVGSAGTGGGKTLVGYYWVYRNLRMFPGESGFIGFPDFGLLNRVLIDDPDPDRMTLLDFLGIVGENPVLHILRRLIRCNSGTIFFNSADRLQGWVGSHVKWAWLDEYDEMPEGAYKMAMERTRYRRGYVLLTGTPRNIRWAEDTIYKPCFGDEELNIKPSQWSRDNPEGEYAWITWESSDNPNYPTESMEEARRTLPAYEFNRLYRGILAKREGAGVIRREWLVDENDRPLHTFNITTTVFERIVQIWDTAEEEGQENDYTVCVTIGLTRTGYCILDLFRERLEFHRLLEAFDRETTKWNPNISLIERKSSGNQLYQLLRAKTRKRVAGVKPDGKKAAKPVRIKSAVVDPAEAGLIYFPEENPRWVRVFVDEVTNYPDDPHDDIPDALAHGLNFLEKPGKAKPQVVAEVI